MVQSEVSGATALAAPTDFIRATSAGKLDFFRLDFVSVSDKCRTVMITSSTEETNGRPKTHWNGARTAKNAKNVPKFMPGDKKDVLMSFSCYF